MITKEIKERKSCLFCASDYHLEMILLPYICKKIENEEIYVITENNLEDSIKLVLDRINIKDNIKKQIRKIGWKNKINLKEKIEKILEEINNDEKIDKNKKITFIINGKYSFINQNNKILEELFDKNDNIYIINCFHVVDQNVDIDKISKEYRKILNTRKI